MATLQVELELLKEFRTSKAAMEREMAELNEKMEAMTSEHKGLVSKMEERFMEEKVCRYTALMIVWDKPKCPDERSVLISYVRYLNACTYVCTNVGQYAVSSTVRCPF